MCCLSIGCVVEFSPAKCALDLLHDLCVTEDTCAACLCNDEVIEQLIKPLKTIMKTKKVCFNVLFYSLF